MYIVLIKAYYIYIYIYNGYIVIIQPTYSTDFEKIISEQYSVIRLLINVLY